MLERKKVSIGQEPGKVNRLVGERGLCLSIPQAAHNDP